MLERMVRGDAAAIASSAGWSPSIRRAQVCVVEASMGWSPRSAGLGRSILGDQPLVGEAVVIMEAQDHVVHERHSEKLPGSDQRLGEPAIVRTRRAVARRMIVRQNHGRRAGKECRTVDLGWGHGRIGQAAPTNLVDTENLIGRIEGNDPGLLMGKIAQPVAERGRVTRVGDLGWCVGQIWAVTIGKGNLPDSVNDGCSPAAGRSLALGGACFAEQAGLRRILHGGCPLGCVLTRAGRRSVPHVACTGGSVAMYGEGQISLISEAAPGRLNLYWGSCERCVG